MQIETFVLRLISRCDPRGYFQSRKDYIPIADDDEHFLVSGHADTSWLQAPVAVAMGVVKVVGDGDCLFHALAYFDGSDGGALRIDVADFLEEEAVNQAGFAGEWLNEADKLRSYKWGGHTAIIAFSQMTATKVVLHTRQADGSATVQEASHGSVANSLTAPVRHILYNGVDHYDALIQVADASGMEAAWPQPPPPLYLKEIEDEFPTLQASLADVEEPKPKRCRFTEARPKKSSGNKRRLNLKAAFQGEQEAAPPCKHCRYTQKTTPPAELRDDILTEMCKVRVAPASQHPHRKQEDLIKDIELTYHHFCVRCILKEISSCRKLLRKANDCLLQPTCIEIYIYIIIVSSKHRSEFFEALRRS